MKTTLIMAAIFCCFQASANEVPVQKAPAVSVTTIFNPSFSFIRGHKQGKNTTVTWGMTYNTGISNFIVERTYEDPFDPYSVWQTVGMIPCTNMPIFKFTDSPFLPGILNYRIIAVLHNNSTVTSGIFSIEIK